MYVWELKNEDLGKYIWLSYVPYEHREGKYIEPCLVKIDGCISGNDGRYFYFVDAKKNIIYNTSTVYLPRTSGGFTIYQLDSLPCVLDYDETENKNSFTYACNQRVYNNIRDILKLSHKKSFDLSYLYDLLDGIYLFKNLKNRYGIVTNNDLYKKDEIEDIKESKSRFENKGRKIASFNRNKSLEFSCTNAVLGEAMYKIIEDFNEQEKLLRDVYEYIKNQFVDYVNKNKMDTNVVVLLNKIYSDDIYGLTSSLDVNLTKIYDKLIGII